MLRITSSTVAPLFGMSATRQIEALALESLPAHTLMQRAGRSVARLAMAIAPHARTVWVACGPGNNGGDGLEAAALLQQRGFAPIVTRLGVDERLPPDARASLQRARSAGVTFADEPPAHWDLAIDALLGIGADRAPSDLMVDWLSRMRTGSAPVLSVDIPTGLNADTGALAPEAPAGGKRHSLSLLTLKPGLFTADGRDAAGEVWYDNLGCEPHGIAPTACIAGPFPAGRPRLQASHKGSYGDVAVIGGAPGMVGAAFLAASAALHAGAGRVFVGLLDRSAARDAALPELMLRDAATLDLHAMAAVCGCGGGAEVRDFLPRVLSTARHAVLDADALNAIARDLALQKLLEERGRRGQSTVLTPHPLEAARLRGVDTAAVQVDRLRSAQQLAERFGAVVVLKGSGTVIAAPGVVPSINLSGNPRLASGGTGDVLAGMIGAALAAGVATPDAARQGVWQHGELADRWPANLALTAGALARAAR